LIGILYKTLPGVFLHNPGCPSHHLQGGEQNFEV
jgi:hypothetical protein